MKTVRLAILAPWYPPAHLGGGPVRSVSAVVRALPEQYRVSVLTSNRDHGATDNLDVPSDQWIAQDGTRVYYASTHKISGYIRGLFRLRAERPVIVYLNSYFNFKFSIIPTLLGLCQWWGRGTRIIIAPRGELSLGALQFKSLKKRAFIAISRICRLHSRVVWHASSALEQEEIRRVLHGEPRIIIRENETELPKLAMLPPSPATGYARFAFISRIVPKKGLDIAIRALASVSLPVELDIYGAEEDVQYAFECRQLAQLARGNGVTVTFRGPLQPERVRGTFHTYDAFLFPTHGENFGHVIAEALSAACPVLVSPTTPWSSSIENGGGRLVETLSPETWSKAISAFASLTPQQRHLARVSAGIAFEEWRSTQDGPSVFQIYQEHFSPNEV